MKNTCTRFAHSLHNRSRYLSAREHSYFDRQCVKRSCTWSPIDLFCLSRMCGSLNQTDIRKRRTHSQVFFVILCFESNFVFKYFANTPHSLLCCEIRTNSFTYTLLARRKKQRKIRPVYWMSYCLSPVPRVIYACLTNSVSKLKCFRVKTETTSLYGQTTELNQTGLSVHTSCRNSEK